MDIRKIQLTGGSSLSVTLPKAWAANTKLGAGDVIGCETNPDGSLSLFAHARSKKSGQEHRIDHDDNEPPEFLFRRIIAAYLNDEEATGITLQDFLDPREFHIEKALRRMSVLTQAMQEEAFRNLQAPDKDAPASAEDRDDEIDRLYWLVNKQYHAMLRDTSYAAKMETTPTQALNHLLVARLLERIADHADRVVTESLHIPKDKRDPKLLARLEKEGREASKLLTRAVTGLLKKDAAGANQVIQDTEKRQKSHGELLKQAVRLGPEAISHLALIIESIQRTTAYAADIAEIAINHEVASGGPAGKS